MAKNNPRNPLGLLSLNTNGMGRVNKRISVINWLKKFHKADTKITFLQETHTTEKSESQWKTEWNTREIYFSHGDSGSKGVAIILPATLNYKINEVIRSKNGRYIAMDIDIDDNPFCLINCYAPNTKQSKYQLQWLEEIQKIIEENSDKNLIIGGDLNDVFDPMLDRYNPKPNTLTTEYMNAWKMICEDFNLADYWRVLNPNTRRYTWRQGHSKTTLRQSRIDHWLVSIHMMYDLENVDILSSIRSDHSLIKLNFYKQDVSQRGPSFWHFNASLLKDSDYIKQITDCFKNAHKKYSELEDKGLLWDLIKMELRSSTICY